jgi:PhnB protein
MPQISTYLFFDGTCAEAMRFYETTLGGKLDLMKYGENPIDQPCPEADADRIMHARLIFDGGILMASDSMPGHPYKAMEGFSLSLVYPTAAEAQRVFDTLAEGGRVNMPWGKTFWVEAFGMVIDRFGTPWMINGGEMSS